MQYEELGTIDIPEYEEIGTIEIPKEKPKESLAKKAFGYGVEAPLGVVTNIAGGMLGLPSGVDVSLQGGSDEEIEQAIAKSAEKWVLPPSTEAGREGTEAGLTAVGKVFEPISKLVTHITQEPITGARVGKYLAEKGAGALSYLPGKVGDLASAFQEGLSKTEAPSVSDLLAPALGEQGSKFISKTGAEFALYPLAFKGAGAVVKGAKNAGKARLDALRNRGQAPVETFKAAPKQDLVFTERLGEQTSLDLGLKDIGKVETKVEVPKEVPVTVSNEGQITLDFSGKKGRGKEADVPDTVEAVDYAALAKSENVIFNGMQESKTAPPQPMFTDPVTKSTFVLNEGETLSQAIARKRTQFGIDKELPPDFSLEDAVKAKANWEKIEPKPIPEANSVQNLNIVVDFEQRLIKDLTAAEERTLNPDIQTLTEKGWTFDEIDNMPVAEVRKAASRARMTDEEIIANTPPEVLAKAEAIKRDLDAKYKVVEAAQKEAEASPEISVPKPSRDFAEDAVRLESYQKQLEDLSKLEQTPEVLDAVSKITEQMMKDVDAVEIFGAADSFAAELTPKKAKAPLSATTQLFKERVQALQQKKAFERVGKPKEEVSPFDETLVREADEHLNKLSEDYWEDILEGEGMPKELNFDMLGLQTVYEISMDALRKSPTVQNLARIGKGIMLEGKRTFGDFRARVREIVGDMWDKVSYLVRDAWNLLKNERGSITAFRDREPNLKLYDKDIKASTITLNMLGLQGVYERLAQIIQRKRAAAKQPGVQITKEITGSNPEGIFKLEEAVDTKLWRRVMSPLRQLANTIGDKHVYNINKAEMLYGHNHMQNAATLHSLLKGIGEAGEVSLRPILEGRSEPANLAVAKAAKGTREWLDYMRERWKEHTRNEFKRHLKPAEFEAINDLLNGEDFVGTFAKYQRKVDPDLLLELYAKYKNIDKWGLDDYVPNVELGSIHILDGEKNLRGVAMSEQHAAMKASEILSANPELKNLYIDTNPNMYADMPTGITARQYWAIRKKLQKALEAQIDGVTKKTAKTLARLAIEREFTIQPTNKFSPFVESRRDVVLGEKNIVPVLYKYSMAMEKKMAFDPVIGEIRKDISNMPRNIRKEVLDLIESAKGRYGMADRAVDEILSGFMEAPRSFALTRTLAKTRGLETNIKLGYRPIAALINRASGIMHIYTKTGASMYFKGRQFLKTPEGKAFVEEVYPYLGMDFAHEGTGMLGMKTEAWKPLGLFEKAELPNRLEGVAANYMLARDGLKLASHDACVEYAIRANWFQNFTYNVSSLPFYMRGPVGRTIFQFKPYLLKEAEFISSLRGAEIPRYITAQLLLAGPKGYLTVIRSLPWLLGLGAWKYWDDFEEYMNKEWPKAWRGVGGFLGVDVTMPATFQFPVEGTDWLGTTLSDVQKIGKIMIDGAKGVDIDTTDLKKLTGQLAPFMRNYFEITNSIMDADGNVRNERGEIIWNIFDATDSEEEKAYKMGKYLMKRVAGAEPIQASIPKTEDNILRRRDEVESLNRIKITNKMIEGLREDNLDEDTIHAFIEYGLTRETLENSYKWKEMSPRMRAVMRSRLRDRLQVLEAYPEPTDLTNQVQDYDSLMEQLRGQ